MNPRSLRVQWAQLAVLSGIHFLVDMFGNMLPAILPATRQQFAMALWTGGSVLAALSLASNGVQVFTGGMRPNETSPLFLHIGMVLAVVADRIGTGPILRLTPAGYLISGALAFWVLRRHPESVRCCRVPPVLETPT